MGTCYACGQPCDDDNFCFGCRECICSGCTINDTCFGDHSPECHLKSDSDDNDFDD